MKHDPEDLEGLAVLMARAQDGDAEAYACLFHRIIPLLRGRIRRRTRHWARHDTEDLLQEVLVSVHAARATYDPGRPFLPWLMAIARHRIADAAKTRARRQTCETVVARPPETFPDPTANAYTEGYGDPEALRQAIAGLPERQREAVRLLKLREMSLKEAARASGMSVGALKVATHRAIGSLRKALRDEVGVENG